MTDFHYDVEKTNHYYIDDITIYGKSVQDGTPTPDEPVPISVVEAANILDRTPYRVGSGYYNPSPGTQIVAQSSDTGITVTDDGTVITLEASSTWRGIVFVSDALEAGKSYRFSYGAMAYTSQTSSFGRSYYTLDADHKVVRNLGNSNTLPTNAGGWTVTLESGEVYFAIGLGVRGSVASFTIDNVWMNEGTTALPYSLYGFIGLQIDDTVTPINLQGNFLASLPDGTRDVLEIDSAGNVAVTKRVGYIASYNDESVGSVYISTTGALTTGASVYYKLTAAQTIDLNQIDLPSNSDEPYTVSVTASITPETAINQTNNPTYEIENPYEHIPGAEIEIPPVHPMMQEWETFDPDNWDEQSMMDYTYQNEWHAVYTVYLGELMQSGVFDWSHPELNWRDAAIDDEQYQRVCDYFNLRFKWREISMLPVLKWFDYLHNKLVYELMPKYKPLYERVAEGINPLSDNSEYYKSRSIESAYPETLLSQNADYITDGRDVEEQRIKEKGTADAMVNFAEVYKGVDQLLLDELEVMFVSLYTTNINGL